MADEGKQVEAAFPPYIILYKDGSVSRTEALPSLPPSPADPGPDGVVSKDVTLNADLGLWVRLFRPSPPPNGKLPLVLYFHGGAFMLASPRWVHAHAFCAQMSKQSKSICISASYRLAPEHRLPAAIDDGVSAFQWLQSQALLQMGGKQELMDPWLAGADFSRCFIAGESAGAVMAHHVAAAKAPSPSPSPSPLPLPLPSPQEGICIRGLILIHPGFIRATRTQEELEAHQDEMINWATADLILKLTLPEGSGKESPIFNPVPTIAATAASHSPILLPKTLVVLADHDAFHILALEYARALEAAGCHVDLFTSHGVGHGFFVFQPDSEQAQSMKQCINRFIMEEAMNV